MGFLTEHCALSYYTEKIFHRCQPFTCGKDDDMDEFFRKDVFDYNEFLMSKNTPEVKRFYEKNGFTMLFKKELQEDLYTRPPKDEVEKVERTTNPRHLETRLMYKDLLEE